jgi:16S rRNA (cytosine1402-N4)-methyltransferase
LTTEGDPLYRPDAVFIDGTLGTAGHTLALLKAHPTCRVIGFDRDAESQQVARQRLLEAGVLDRVIFVQCDFRFAH